MVAPRYVGSRALALTAACALALIPACSPAPRPGDPLVRAGDEIAAAGQLFHTTTRVVLWNDPGGYDAYRLHRRFEPETSGPARHAARIARYDSHRAGLPEGIARRVREQGWRLEDLRRAVRQIVIHFDACGTSRRCFEVLHDIRGLSAHFLLDLDGTVYQTLDLKERAWHASQANSASIGIEIANIGAFKDEGALAGWYVRDAGGVRISIPEEMGDGGLPPAFIGRPRRDRPLRGTINGKDLLQYDYTEEQYRALERLLITLCRLFPEVKARAPLGRDGRLRREAFASDEELLGFHGLIGHWHVTRDKVDPGPAFDWDRVLGALRRAGIPQYRASSQAPSVVVPCGAFVLSQQVDPRDGDPLENARQRAMAQFKLFSPPASGTPITVGSDGELCVPDDPIIPYIEGDGTGPDIWAASRLVFDAAVERAYGGKRGIRWFEVFSGEKAFARFGDWLPEDTLEAINRYHVAIKGPLTTPVGGGIRSLNVTLRQRLDLFACVRPVRHWKGVPAPVKSPEKVNVVIFRENTEDVYAGIEWQAGSEGARRVIGVARELGFYIRPESAIGIKPMSAFGSKRLVRKAIRHAVDRGLPSVTLVHKGNIMKFTEGAFKDWGYEVAREEFADATVTEAEVQEKHGGKPPAGKIVIRDRIADSMFQQILLRPGEYSVIALPNLNGDYLSDAAAAQVGGLGLAPGGNLSDTHAVFEATHGTAPKYAGQDVVNPSSVILSGVMLLEHLGWEEAGGLVTRAIEKTILQKTVTYDLERLMEGAKRVKCSEFARAIVANMA